MIFPTDLMRLLSKGNKKKNEKTTYVSLFLTPLFFLICFYFIFLVEKMSLRIIIKCIEKIYENILIKSGRSEKNCFKILLELYRFFKQHPAEELDVNFLY